MNELNTTLPRLLTKNFECNKPLRAEELNQLVDYINNIIIYLNSNQKGSLGEQGIQGPKGDPGKDGKDGRTPRIEIGPDGYWWIDGRNTNVKASGGEGGSNTVQRIYFINRPIGNPPSTPSTNNYVSNSNLFSVNGQTWTFRNENPSVGYDTWAIWVSFTNGTPMSIQGPIKIYNGANNGSNSGGGSNGEDGEEIEWIYTRTSLELNDTIFNSWEESLNNYKPSSKIVDSAIISGVTWYNHPSGVDKEHPYEYASFRASTNDVNGNRVWGVNGFSAPLIWSHYGEKGTDGDGVEYIYYADTSGNPPNYNDWPPSWTLSQDFQNPEYIPKGSGWKDEPFDLSQYGPGSKQWVSIRKKSSENGLWGPYCEPKLWSGIGNDSVVDGYLVSSYNTNMIATTDSTNNITSFTDSCGYEVFHNGIRVNYGNGDNDFSLSVDDSNITRSDGNSISNGEVDVSFSAGGIVTVTLTNILNIKGNINIPITVTLPDGNTRNSAIIITTISGELSGEYIDLYTNANIIRTDYYDQNVVPNLLEVGVKIGTNSGSNIYYAGESNGYTYKYYYDNDDSNPIQITTSPIELEIKRSGNESHNSITILMYKNDSFLESKLIPYIKDAAPGIGINAINYNISVINTSVVVNNNQISGSILFQIIKQYGEDTLYINSLNGNPDGEIVNVKINGTNNDINITNDNNIWTVGLSKKSYDSSEPYSYISVKSSTGAPLASVVIPVVINSSLSQVQGLNAIVMRFRSYNDIISSNGDGYGNILNGTTPDSNGIIYKDIVLFDGNSGNLCYYCVYPTNTEIRDKIWAGIYPPNNSDKWMLFNQIEASAFLALLAEYAYIGNLTSHEIIITKNNKPVVGMTRGTAVGKDPLSNVTRGDIRIWAGLPEGSNDLTNSKFYVTEGGLLKAEDANIEGEVMATSFQVINKSKTNKVKVVEITTVDDNLRNNYNGIRDSGLVNGDPIGLVYNNGDLKYFFDFAPVDNGTFSAEAEIPFNITKGANSGRINIKSGNPIYKITDANSSKYNKYVNLPKLTASILNEFSAYEYWDYLNIIVRISYYFLIKPVSIYRKFEINNGIKKYNDNYYIVDSPARIDGINVLSYRPDNNYSNVRTSEIINYSDANNWNSNILENIYVSYPANDSNSTSNHIVSKLISFVAEEYTTLIRLSNIDLSNGNFV